MFVQVLCFFLALGLSAIAVAAPHQNGAPPFHNTTCIAVPTTVYVTISGSVSTVYITRPSTNFPPTTTITSVTTLHSTRTLTRSLSLASSSMSATGKGVDHPSYGFTVTDNIVYTVTEIYTTPTPTATSVTDGASLSVDDVYQFYVENSTTVWIGATPSTVETDAVVITRVVTIIPVDTLILGTHLTQTSTRRISTTIHVTSTSTRRISTVRSTATVTTNRTIFSSTLTPIPTSVSPTTHPLFTEIFSGGWNSTSSSLFVEDSVTVVTGSFTVHTSRSKQSTFATDIPSIDIYGSQHPAISISSHYAASGFQTNNPSHAANVTSIIMPTRPSLIATLNGSATSHYLSVTVSSNLTTTLPTTLVSSTAFPPFSNLPTQWPGVTSSTLGIGYSSSTSVPSSLTIPKNTTAVTSSLPSSTSTPFPLGAICNSTSQCANGAECYATNSMLVTVCGNFQASCSSDIQCAFNTCNQGFCNGPKPPPSSTSTFWNSTDSSGQNLTSSLLGASAASTLVAMFSTASGNGVISTSSTSGAVTNGPQSYSVSWNTTGSSSTVLDIGTSSSLRLGIQTWTSSTVSSSSTASSTTAAACEPSGPNYGDFIINFDGIPSLVMSDTGSGTAAPLFNPYHQFEFSDGFTVNPPPKDAYNPSSPPLLLKFTPLSSRPQAGPADAEHHITGQISSGDHTLTDCFNFNFYGGFFGCNSTESDCDFTFSGYRFDIHERREILVNTQTGSVQACPAQTDCILVPVLVDEGFKNLTHLRINATVEGEPKSWWVDDLKLGWFDNSCETGKRRLMSPVRH